MSLAIHDRLGRLKALRNPAAPGERDKTGGEIRGHTPDLPEGWARLAELLGAAPRSNKYGEHLGLRRWFSEPIGCEPPSCRVDAAAMNLLAAGLPEDAGDPEKWLFLDTETTGLAGGTGTYAFLTGIAWWNAGGLEVEQFFMREHSEEHSVLVALAERMAERPVLVTFNGKSFDWPLLETRYRMTRSIRPPRTRAHLDFLHAARNLWRPRLGSVRLSELERHVLGWERNDELISSLIPQFYFDFLRGGRPEPLLPIFHHNQMDLRGLAGVAARTLALLADPEANGEDGLEIFGVSRMCERRGEAGRARLLYERSIERELPPETERTARQRLARLAKREGNLTLACELWESMLGGSLEGLEAYDQLAIYYERHGSDAQRASALVREALAELRKGNRTGLISPAAHRRLRARFEKRLARLERKIGRPVSGELDLVGTSAAIACGHSAKRKIAKPAFG